MATWILKATVQKAISLLPAGHQINYALQKYVTKMRLDDAYMDRVLVHCADHVRHFREQCAERTEPATLELGTGWYPVVPIGLYLCGAGRTTTVDLTPHLRAENLAIAVRKFREYGERGRLAELLPQLRAERLAALTALADKVDGMSAEEILAALDIRYLVADARHLELAEGCVDLIHSNDVFEHIDPDVLHEILAEFKRIGAPGGLMSHFVDMSDHFSHFDRSIGVYNFLRYGEAQWKLIDNGIAPQSRLRLPEYRALYDRLAIAITQEKRWPGDPAELSGIRLAPRFAAMHQADVAVTHAYFISKLPPTPP